MVFWMGVVVFEVHIGCTFALNVQPQPSLSTLCPITGCTLKQRANQHPNKRSTNE